MNANMTRIAAGTVLLLVVAIRPSMGDDGRNPMRGDSPDITVNLDGLVESTTTAGADFASPSTLADPLHQPIDTPDRAGRRTVDLTSLSRWTRQPIAAAILSLAIVMIAYLLLRGLWRGKSRRRPGFLPRQVVEVIGYIPMGNRQQLQLVRLGSKLVLVAVTAGGAKSLAEVTDPVEVDQILAACRCGPSALASALGRWSTGRSGGREAARAVFEA